MSRKRWIRKAIKRPGAFRRKAAAAGVSVRTLVRRVRANPNRYSSRTRRQANLANTLGRLRHRRRR